MEVVLRVEEKKLIEINRAEVFEDLVELFDEAAENQLDLFMYSFLNEFIIIYGNGCLKNAPEISDVVLERLKDMVIDGLNQFIKRNDFFVDEIRSKFLLLKKSNYKEDDYNSEEKDEDEE